MDNEIAITTVDNPWNPFTDWDSWLAFDIQHGYNTCERLSSTTITSDSLSDEENEESILHSMKIMMRTGAISKEGNIIEYKILRKSTKNS